MKKYLKAFFPQDEILGIDIGSYSIKFVLFSKEKDKITLKNWGYVPIELPEKAQASEVNSIISSEISNFVKKSKIKTKYVATSVSGNSVIIRYIKLPKMNKKDLDTKIYVEAEAFIPFDINDVYLSYYVVNDDIFEEGQNKMEIVLVAAKKEVVEEKISIIKNAGLLPVLVDVDSFAIENLINHIKIPSQDIKSILLLNIGQRTTNLSILINTPVKDSSNETYYSRLVRDIFIAGSSIDRAISKKFNMDAKKVDEFKKTIKILITDEEKLNAIKDYDKMLISTTKAISGILKELISDVNRSIDFFASSGIETNISKIYICGGSSSISNLNMYLFDELKIPVEYLDPFVNVLNRPENMPFYIRNSMCVAAGLSLRSIKDL